MGLSTENITFFNESIYRQGLRRFMQLKGTLIAPFILGLVNYVTNEGAHKHPDLGCLCARFETKYIIEEALQKYQSNCYMLCSIRRCHHLVQRDAQFQLRKDLCVLVQIR